MRDCKPASSRQVIFHSQGRRKGIQVGVREGVSGGKGGTCRKGGTAGTWIRQEGGHRQECETGSNWIHAGMG